MTHGYTGGMQGYSGGMHSYGAGMQGSTGGMSGSGGTAPTGSAGYGTEELQSPSKAEDPSRLLKAIGLPTEDGHLRWPLPLRVMASPATEERQLREQIDALFEEVASEAARGEVKPFLLDEMHDAVKEFRALVFRDRPDRLVFSQAEWQDSDRFLHKLDHAQKLLKRSQEPAAQEERLTAEEKVSEVRINDDAFEPKTITVPVGATVQWSHRGQHIHTVTADDGSWGSKEVGPKATYRHTFTRPGTYSYHCAHHSEQMWGKVVVKEP
jgi:plastocyanin